MRIGPCALILLVGVTHSLPAGALYSVSALGSGFSSGYSINNAGQVTGFQVFTHNGDTNAGAFVYSNGQVTELGTLGGCCSSGTGINDSGEVTGSSTTSDGNTHAFLYTNGQMMDLGTFAGVSYSYGINDRGQVTGQRQTVAGSRAYLYSDSHIIDLTASNSYGAAINNAGQVTGWAVTSSFSGLTVASPPPQIYHAFLYSNGELKDLGTLGGLYSSGAGINEVGQVTGGVGTATGVYHAFLYSNGQMADLGALGGLDTSGVGINSLGEVVGTSYLSGLTYHAFLYSNGQMLDLNDLIDPALGITLTEANAINDHGQIVANGYGTSRETQGFLLTPVSVPEPGTGGLLGIMVGGSAVLVVTRYLRKLRCGFMRE